jgi:hypothetical protein
MAYRCTVSWSRHVDIGMDGARNGFRGLALYGGIGDDAAAVQKTTTARFWALEKSTRFSPP